MLSIHIQIKFNTTFLESNSFEINNPPKAHKDKMVSPLKQTNEIRPRVSSMDNSKEIFTDFQKDFSTCSSEDNPKITNNLYSKYAENYEHGMKAINY